MTDGLQGGGFWKKCLAVWLRYSTWKSKLLHLRAFVTHWCKAQRSQSKSGCNSHVTLMQCLNSVGLTARAVYTLSSIWRVRPWSIILWSTPDASSHKTPWTCCCSCKRHFEPSSSDHAFPFSYFYSQWEKRNGNFLKTCNSYRPAQNFIETHLIPKTASWGWISNACCQQKLSKST